MLESENIDCDRRKHIAADAELVTSGRFLGILRAPCQV